MAAWTPWPSGQKLTVPAGTLLAVVASVKASHSASDLHTFAQSHGLQLFDYAEQGARPGLGPDPRGPDYRYVAAAATAGAAVSLPWEVPWPASMFDDSQLVSAWTAPAGSSLNASPPPPAPTAARSPSVSLWPLAALAGLGLALGWRARRKKRIHMFSGQG